MFDPDAPERFDLATTYEKEIKPLMEMVLAACDQHGIPAVMMFSVGSEDMHDHMTRFNVSGSVIGHLYRMPTEMMLAAALLEPTFSGALVNLYREYLALAMTKGFTAGEDQNSRTCYRGANAYVAAQIAIREAEEKLHLEVSAADRVIGLFANTALQDYTMNGGTAHE